MFRRTFCTRCLVETPVFSFFTSKPHHKNKFPKKMKEVETKPGVRGQGRRWIIEIKTHSNKKPLIMQAASGQTAATWVKLLSEVWNLT